MGGAPKKLTFVGDGSSGSLTEERGHKKLLEITAPSEPQLVPTTGEVASGLDGEDARGKEHSTMQVPVGGRSKGQSVHECGYTGINLVGKQRRVIAHSPVGC